MLNIEHEENHKGGWDFNIKKLNFLKTFLILRSVNSKFWGTGVMCRVPALSLCRNMRELAPDTALGLKSVSSVIPAPPATLELLMFKGSVAVICV